MHAASTPVVELTLPQDANIYACNTDSIRPGNRSRRRNWRASRESLAGIGRPQPMDNWQATEAYGTEVDMSTEPSLPEGWTVRSLRSCLRAAPAYGINAAAVPFDDGLPPYLRITDISDDNRFRPSPRISIEHPNASAFFLNQRRSRFCSNRSERRESYLYDPDDGPLVFAGFLIRVSSNQKMFDQNF